MQQRINNCKEKERQNTSKRNKKTNVIRITNTSETSSDIFSIHEKKIWAHKFTFFSHNLNRFKSTITNINNLFIFVEYSLSINFYTTQILKRWGWRSRHNKHTLGYNLVLMAKHCFWTISNLINGSSVMWNDFRVPLWW